MCGGWEGGGGGVVSILLHSVERGTGLGTGFTYSRNFNITEPQCIEDKTLWKPSYKVSQVEIVKVHFNTQISDKSKVSPPYKALAASFLFASQYTMDCWSFSEMPSFQHHGELHSTQPCLRLIFPLLGSKQHLLVCLSNRSDNCTPKHYSTLVTVAPVKGK